MNKNYEYKEPEFKVVVTKAEDVITTSTNPDFDYSSTNRRVSSSWEMGTFTI